MVGFLGNVEVIFNKAVYRGVGKMRNFCVHLTWKMLEEP